MSTFHEVVRSIDYTFGYTEQDTHDTPIFTDIARNVITFEEM